MSTPRLWSGRVELHGQPQPQGSKRAVVKDGRALIIDDCPGARPWRNELALLMRRDRPDRPLRAAVRVSIVVFARRPKAHLNSAGSPHPAAPAFPATGPDLDKIQRAVGDAGTGLWWADDDQIATWEAHRRFGDCDRIVVQAVALEPEPEERKALAAAAELAARTRTMNRAAWETLLQVSSGTRFAAARRRIRTALDSGPDDPLAITFSSGEWSALDGAVPE